MEPLEKRLELLERKFDYFLKNYGSTLCNKDDYYYDLLSDIEAMDEKDE